MTGIFIKRIIDQDDGGFSIPPDQHINLNKISATLISMGLFPSINGISQ